MPIFFRSRLFVIEVDVDSDVDDGEVVEAEEREVDPEGAKPVFSWICDDGASDDVGFWNVWMDADDEDEDRGKEEAGSADCDARDVEERPGVIGSESLRSVEERSVEG